MNKYTLYNDGFTFERITKAQARRCYKMGLTVIVCPCNLHPFTPWHVETRLNRHDREHLTLDEIGVINDFNNQIASFEYYNCTNRETGKYSAFYIPVRAVDRFTGETPTPETIGTIKEYDRAYMEKGA